MLESTGNSLPTWTEECPQCWQDTAEQTSAASLVPVWTMHKLWAFSKYKSVALLNITLWNVYAFALWLWLLHRKHTEIIEMCTQKLSWVCVLAREKNCPNTLVYTPSWLSRVLGELLSVCRGKLWIKHPFDPRCYKACLCWASQDPLYPSSIRLSSPSPSLLDEVLPFCFLHRRVMAGSSCHMHEAQLVSFQETYSGQHSGSPHWRSDLKILALTFDL